ILPVHRDSVAVFGFLHGRVSQYAVCVTWDRGVLRKQLAAQCWMEPAEHIRHAADTTREKSHESGSRTDGSERFEARVPPLFLLASPGAVVTVCGDGDHRR